MAAQPMIRYEDLRFDCALYNGYKPCPHGNACAGCRFYEPLPPPSGDLPGWETLPPDAPPALPSPNPSGPTRILIIKVGAMGDVLRTTTLLPALKRAYPSSFITWVTDPPARPLLSANPLIDELLPFDEAHCAALAERDFDLLLNYEKEPAPLALAGRIRARGRIGFAPTRWGRPAVFNRESAYGLLLGLDDEVKFRLNTKSYPQIICEMTGMTWQRDPYVLELTEASHRRRAEVETRLSPDRPRIGLNTGCGAVFRTKQWPLANWVELIRCLQARAEVDILLLGGRAEEELNRAILDQTTGVVDTGTGNSLEEFFGIVDACDLVVTSDTLGMHVAIALRKWVVALFGSTSAVEIDLYDRGEKVITDFDCAPCYRKTCDKVPMCMEQLRGTAVGEAVLRGLARLGAADRCASRTTA